MRVIELFAGIGGFRLGLERAGHEIVFTNEWLEKPARIYEKQFGDKPNRQDIRELTADDIPNADLIVGGFPCATFSIAGKRTGLSLEDTRGTLFYEMFRLARDKRIPYILFENVKGLLNHDRGKTFEVILKVLDEMGYDAQWELLDSQNFGVPQHRERIFLIGNLRGKPRPKVFPISQSVAKNEEEDRRKPKKRKGVQTDISPTLDAHYSKGGASRPYVAQWRRGHFRDYKSDGSPTLTANMGTGGHNVPFMRIPQKKVRKFTPLECERLQGLPDNFTKYYEDGSLVSDSERYERCGRTVTIPVIEAIGKKLHEFYE